MTAFGAQVARLAAGSGIADRRQDGGVVVVEVGSGAYRFACLAPSAPIKEGS